MTGSAGIRIRIEFEQLEERLSVVFSESRWRAWPLPVVAAGLLVFAACGARERRFLGAGETGSGGSSGGGNTAGSGAAGSDAGTAGSSGSGAGSSGTAAGGGSASGDASTTGDSSGGAPDAGPDGCARNACNGCAPLSGAPGDACGSCGALVCDPGGESVSCQDPAQPEFTALAAGGDHTCALTAAGGVRCWGKNASGQLGDGTTTDRAAPPTADVLTGAQAITAGSEFSCALMTGGSVKCWGSNAYNQLGDGTTTDRWTPVDVVTPSGLLTGIKVVVAGYQHACALTMSGGMRCWGLNNAGQIGDGTMINRSAAPNTDLLTGVQEVAPSINHTCALIADGPECWGSNVAGQLGDGTLTSRPTAARVLTASEPLTGARSVATGGYHSCVIMSGSDAVRCWGNNGTGALGDGTTLNRTTAPDMDGVASVQRIAAGAYHTCVMTSTGGARCWGLNTEGEVGEGTLTNRTAPSVSDTLTGVRALAAGAFHNCALTDTGLLCWGKNANGQLGDGTTTNRTVPTPVLLGCP